MPLSNPFLTNINSPMGIPNSWNITSSSNTFGNTTFSNNYYINTTIVKFIIGDDFLEDENIFM